tara:strand:+ start:515 stop:853 length:339 start_codon:yes stop_codon:yes gene_type:complete
MKKELQVEESEEVIEDESTEVTDQEETVASDETEINPVEALVDDILLGNNVEATDQFNTIIDDRVNNFLDVSKEHLAKNWIGDDLGDEPLNNEIESESQEETINQDDTQPAE